MDISKLINRTKYFLHVHMEKASIQRLKLSYSLVYRISQKIMYFYCKSVKNSIMIKKNMNKKYRMLEIGSGSERLQGFETLNVVWKSNIDYILDASKKLPFHSECFDLIFASHVLEHIPWFMIKNVLIEWTRLLKRGGRIEIWVPDAYKICRLLIDIEDGIFRTEWFDEWRPLNDENDPYKWVSGRLLYGAKKDYQSWHRSILTPRYLENILSQSGIINIRKMKPNEFRGNVDHGWINLGLTGTKV